MITKKQYSEILDTLEKYLKLQENNKVKTHSVGEEPYRKVVISLAGKKV